PGAPLPRAGAGGDERLWLLGQARNDVGVPGLRADAVVGQGAGAARDAVRGGRGRGRSLDVSRRQRPGAGGGPADGRREEQGRGPRGPVSTTRAGRRPVRGSVSPLLLAGRVAGRPEVGAVPPAGDRRASQRRQGPPLARGGAGEG